MKSVFLRATGASIVLSLAAAAPVLAHGDIWLYSQNGALKTGTIEHGDPTGVEGVRVFHAELGAVVDNASDEPGLLALDGGLDPAGTLSFTINRALRMWNGSSFGALAANTMDVGFDTLSATSPASDVATPGFGVSVDASGSLHDHYDFLLNAPARVQGIWLLDVTFHYTGLASTNPVWILFSQDVLEEDVGPAEAWAAANVPTPGAIGLGGVGVMMLARRRR